MEETPRVELPDWARELVTLYESGAVSQFILYGNVNDRLVIRGTPKPQLGSLFDFLLTELLPRFDVVLSYDLGSGVRVRKGGELFSQWPSGANEGQLPKSPRAAVELLTHYFRYVANLSSLSQQPRLNVATFVREAHLLAPCLPYTGDYDLNSIASLLRDWAADDLLTAHPLATFLVTENLNDLHPLIVNNPRAARIKIALPSVAGLRAAFEQMAPSYPLALAQFRDDLTEPTQQLAGATISSIESLLKTKEYKKEALERDDLVTLKKELVEKDANGLIEFIESERTLDDIHAQAKVVSWLRQDVELWRRNDLQALPMGYLLCGPVGTGKTFMVECLAGEAGVPVVKLKNFRDRWVGSSEGNLEKIFRLLHALGRCFVFVDEADQALGKRDSGSGDSGVSGRLYSMLAEEMSDTRQRGKIIWVLASSRPDLIEVDLKRPGRIDVKIPIFPTTTQREGFDLIRALGKRRGLELTEDDFAALQQSIPSLLTAGAAEALAVKVYRHVRTTGIGAGEALRTCLDDYQSPVAPDIMTSQIRLAVREASDLEFVPEVFRKI